MSLQENSGSASFLGWDSKPFPRSPQKYPHSWWERVNSAASDMARKGINSLVILGAWTLWRHRNSCVFDGAAPSVAGALAVAEDDRRSWSLAGARGLSLLDALAAEWVVCVVLLYGFLPIFIIFLI